MGTLSAATWFVVWQAVSPGVTVRPCLWSNRQLPINWWASCDVFGIDAAGHRTMKRMCVWLVSVFFVVHTVSKPTYQD